MNIPLFASFNGNDPPHPPFCYSSTLRYALSPALAVRSLVFIPLYDLKNRALYLQYESDVNKSGQVGRQDCDLLGHKVMDGQSSAKMRGNDLRHGRIYCLMAV